MPTFEEAYLPKIVPDIDCLLSFGFKRNGDVFVYHTEIMDGAFALEVVIKGSEALTRLTETDTNEPYDLYRIETAHGDYVGAIREEVKAVLLDIRARCYPLSWTKRGQPAHILSYIKEKYDEEVDYPWDDTFGVLRRKDNQKWFALFMPLPVSKVGIEEDREEVIMNIRHDGMAVDHRVFYPAYHMTKKTWVSMVLDGSVPIEEVLDYIEESRELAGKDKKRK